MTREEAVQYLQKIYLMADITDEYGDMDDTTPYETAVDMAIEALEEPETGKWIGGELGECSVCGYGGCASDIWNGYHRDTYCPSCGAHLEV